MDMIVAESRGALAARLAAEVAGELRHALDTHGRASLAVPGGTTPGPFLERLGAEPLPWERVTVTLSDERCVPADHPRSNYRLVAATLLAGPARAARLVPLYDPALPPEESLAVWSAELARAVLPLDVCVLGMGDDLHTASLFPGAAGLAAALDPAGEHPLLPVRAPADGERRITLTAPCLRAAGHVHLLIQGTAKREALDRALASRSVAEAPVRVVLDRPGRTTVWYAD
ncbi:6-phosphogluconolactonase [Azospirillum thermophilum]|uniref:6-phosphogluconolactonase n=2 Tax=Azospirillum thermophilum TaxID=2202148 RepID=A0A2S2CVY8_9PROT|nr:6-phosphogluconolactonase [Azospirillum thermophilum]